MLDPEYHKWKTAKNRNDSAAILAGKGIEFESKNNGAHLIVKAEGLTIDFWPGTGKYIQRGTDRYKRGVFNLLKDIRAARDNRQ